MTAAKIMRSVAGITPALEKAIGRVSTPPPHTVAKRLAIAIVGDDLRVSQSCAGLRNSSDCPRLSSSWSVGQKVESRLRRGGL